VEVSISRRTFARNVAGSVPDIAAPVAAIARGGAEAAIVDELERLAHNTNETNPTGRMDFMSVVPLPLAVGASGNSARQTKLSETVCAKITVMGSGGQGQTLCSARIAPIATGRDDSGGEPAPRETVGLRCLLWAIPRARQPLLAPTPLPIRSRSRRESLRAAIHIEEDLPGSRRRPVVRVFRRIDR
jgi:hypothetical protein